MSEDDLVAFFRSLPARHRKEYDTLVELDRKHGEDVHAEREADGKESRQDVS